MKILIAGPRGCCAGVEMAIRALDQALESFGAPLYAYHQIVHNDSVVRDFERRGVIFVGDVNEVPPGQNVVFSAHGVSPAVRETCRQRNLRIVDATCPLVTKVHREAQEYARKGHSIVLIGHRGHDEVEGILGEAPGSITVVSSAAEASQLALGVDRRAVYLTQTTWSVDDACEIALALERRFPHIEKPGKDDICYATQNRQEAVRALAPEADITLVIGSRQSSNSQRLVEVARQGGRPAYLINGFGDIDPSWLAGAATVLLTAGASVPEALVAEVVDKIVRRFGATIEERILKEELVRFPLPTVASAAAAS